MRIDSRSSTRSHSLARWLSLNFRSQTHSHIRNTFSLILTLSISFSLIGFSILFIPFRQLVIQYTVVCSGVTYSVDFYVYNQPTIKTFLYCLYLYNAIVYIKINAISSQRLSVFCRHASNQNQFLLTTRNSLAIFSPIFEIHLFKTKNSDGEFLVRENGFEKKQNHKNKGDKQTQRNTLSLIKIEQT